MPAPVPPTAAPALRTRRRWGRRFGWGFGVLLLLLVVFYRPLGHWGLRHFGRDGLAKAGVTGEWNTSGSLLGGIVVDDLKLTGNEHSQVNLVSLKHASLEYDLMSLRPSGRGKVLKRLVIQDLTMDLDLSKSPSPRPPAPSPSSRTKPILPEVLLPEIKIEHFNLQLKLANQKVLVVRDYSLVFDPFKPGVIEAALLDLPGNPPVENMRGTTRATHAEPQKLILENVALWPGTVLKKLIVDLTNLPRDSAAVELAGHHGPTHFTLSGRSGDWFASTTAEVDLEVSQISNGTLAFWNVPSGGSVWQAGKVRLLARGPVLRPDLLETTLTVEDASFAMGGTMVAPIGLSAAMGGGKLGLGSFSALVGTNQISATGEAALPASWVDFARARGALDYRIAAPDLSALLPPETEVSGKVEGGGGVTFDQLALTGAVTDLAAASLRFKGIPVESAGLQATLSEGLIQVQKAEVKLNAQNVLTASGELNLEGARPLKVKWQSAVGDLTTVPAEVRAGMLWPEAGRVISEGEAAGALTEWQAGKWNSLEGQVTADVSGLKLKQARLDFLRLRAGAKAGVVELEDLSAQLAPDHQLKASGSLDLTEAALSLAGSLKLHLPDVSKATIWSTSFGGPGLQGGHVEAQWAGEGQLKPMLMSSQGKVIVRGLKVEGIPELLGFSAALVQSGGDVSLSGLKASAGPWRAAGSVLFDGWHVVIPKMEGFAGDQKLLTLSARIPVHAGSIPVDSPLSLALKVDALDAAKLAAALGKTFPVQGLLNAEGDFSGTLRDLTGRLSAGVTRLRPAKAMVGLKLEPAAIQLDAAVSQGKLTLNGKVSQSPLQPLVLTAGVPLDLVSLLEDPARVRSIPLSAEVALPASSLAFLPAWVPALRAVNGTAAADFKVTGTVGRPLWQGRATVSVDQASFVSGSLPTVKDLKFKARVDERQLRLDEASVMLAGGRLRLAGGVGLENPADPLLDLKLTAEEVLVLRDENLSLRANSSISCRGPLKGAEVRGQIELVHGRVFKEIEFLPLSLPDDLPPPPAPTRLGKEGAPTLPPPFDRWNFDVSIKTGDPVRLMGNVARGNAVVDLKLIGKGARPDLSGTVKLEEMWLKLPFSRLNVTEGLLSFTPDQPFDPRIRITGESITGSRIVQVFVEGRAVDPRVRMTSSPPLPEGEIATLLATGVTTSDLATRGDEAAGRAAFVLLKQTYRKLFPRAATSGDNDEPPRLSFDFSVFGNDPERRGVSAIYELNPRWRAIGRVGETGSFRGLLHYLIRFR